MDVYVVHNLWNGRASVAGVGTELKDAEDIADRLGGDYGWTEWVDSPTPGQRTRRVLWADGSVHPEHEQEIVRVPLAGAGPKIDYMPPTIGVEVRRWVGWDLRHYINDAITTARESGRRLH